MKKKLGVVITVAILLTMIVYSSKRSNATNIQMDELWTLQQDRLKEITVEGLSQDAEISVNATKNEDTTIKVNGNISKKTLKELKKTRIEEDKIKVILGDQNGFSILSGLGADDILKIDIDLGKNAKVDKLNISGITSNVSVKLPKNFDGVIKTEALNGGEVLKQPKTNGTQSTYLTVSTTGDILIDK